MNDIFFFNIHRSRRGKRTKKATVLCWFIRSLTSTSVNTIHIFIVNNMMLSIYLIGISFLIQTSLADQCPSSTYCTCSSDLTIITCTNRRLTDEFLFNLKDQFPESTIVLNLSSNSLTSIHSLSNLNNLQTLDLSSNQIRTLPSNLFSRFPQLSSLYLPSNSLKTIPKTFNEISNINLDISNNPLDCQCQLKWLIKWFETINHRRRINCQKSNHLTENDFCSSRKSFLHLSPSQSQVAYQNDPFTLNCSSNTEIYWTINGEFYSNQSTISIDHLQFNHSGLWTCHSLNQNRSISLRILNRQTNHFCPSIQMDTSKGHFYWPRTLTSETIQLSCPFKSAAWLNNHSEEAKASHTCSMHRQWIDLDLSQCAFRTNISREFDRLISVNQTNLLSKLVNYMSKINLTDLQFDDVVFLIDLIDEEHEKYTVSKRNLEEISMLIYRLTDFILQANREEFQKIHQYRLALNRLRLILEKLIDLTNYSWVYVGKQLTAMTLESPLPPTVCFIPNRPLLTIICGIINRQYKRHESRLATLQFPVRSNVSSNQSAIYRILFYRQGSLFISDVNRNSNPIIYMKPVTSRNYSIVQLTFYGQSNQASIALWNTNQSSWQIKPSICKINQQNLDFVSSECVLTKNNSLSISYVNQYDEYTSLFLSRSYLELAIYVSSLIASACFFISILFYVCCHKVYLMPRSFFHCLINYWLSLAILLPLFAFGIRQSHYLLFCQFVAVSLHYLCLTTILWLTLLTYCIWQKLYVIWSGKGHGDEDSPGKSSVTVVDYDDDGLPIVKLKAKPVIQFYFLAYGISFIICGINVAISRDQYITNQICFLNNFESLLTLFIPIGIFTFLLLIFLLAARINIKRLTNEAIRLRNLPDESEIEPETDHHDTEENILSSKPNEALPIIVPSNNLLSEQNFAHIDCRQSHLDSVCSSDMDHQHQPNNQLLSILFQLILLILIFLASLAIYIQPLHAFNLRFEHSIYNHVYGFLVLLLAFYVLAFYVLSRSDLTMHCRFYDCCSIRKKKRFLDQSYAEPPPPPQTPQQSPSHPLLPNAKENDSNKIIANQYLSADDSFTEPIPAPSPPHSHYSSSIYQCQVPDSNEMATLNNGYSYGSKYQSTIASKYYARHRHVLKTSVSNSETSLQQNDTYPLTTLIPIQQESVEDQTAESIVKPMDMPKEVPPMTNGNAKFHLPSVISPRTFIRPSAMPISPRSQPSPSQAIIRPLPIIRLSSPATVPKSSSPITEEVPGRNSYRVMPSPSTEERHATYIYLNKNSHLIQQDSPAKEKSSVWKKPANGHLPHVAYIDEDDEGSVSLKSSACDSTSSSTASPIITRKDRSQTLSSSSSSSSNFSNNFPHENSNPNQIILHESSV